jgi:hypothetical protein
MNPYTIKLLNVADSITALAYEMEHYDEIIDWDGEITAGVNIDNGHEIMRFDHVSGPVFSLAVQFDTESGSVKLQ